MDVTDSFNSLWVFLLKDWWSLHFFSLSSTFWNGFLISWKLILWTSTIFSCFCFSFPFWDVQELFLLRLVNSRLVAHFFWGFLNCEPLKINGRFLNAGFIFLRRSILVSTVYFFMVDVSSVDFLCFNLSNTSDPFSLDIS